MGYGVDLTGFDRDFAAAEATSGTLDVPDGKYNVYVYSVELKNAKSSGAPMLAFELRVIDGEHVGKKIWVNRVFTQKTLGWVKSDLETLGLRLEKLSDLSKHLEKLLDLRLVVTLKTKGENQHVYFNKRLAAEEASGGAVKNGQGKTPQRPVASAPDDDDVPF